MSCCRVAYIRCHLHNAVVYNQTSLHPRHSQPDPSSTTPPLGHKRFVSSSSARIPQVFCRWPLYPVIQTTQIQEASIESPPSMDQMERLRKQAPATPPVSPPTGFAGQQGFSTPLFTEKPNILYIMADQLAAPQLKVYNKDSQIKTPHLDKLAEQSVVFDSAYCNSPLCAPSRMVSRPKEARYACLGHLLTFSSSLVGNDYWPTALQDWCI